MNRTQPDPTDYFSWPVGKWYYSSYYGDWNYRFPYNEDAGEDSDYVAVNETSGYWEMEYDFGNRSEYHIRMPETITSLEEAQTYALAVVRMGAA